MSEAETIVFLRLKIPTQGYIDRNRDTSVPPIKWSPLVNIFITKGPFYITGGRWGRGGGAHKSIIQNTTSKCEEKPLK
jgi:hypothetical protein